MGVWQSGHVCGWHMSTCRCRCRHHTRRSPSRPLLRQAEERQRAALGERVRAVLTRRCHRHKHLHKDAVLMHTRTHTYARLYKRAHTPKPHTRPICMVKRPHGHENMGEAIKRGTGGVSEPNWAEPRARAPIGNRMCQDADHEKRGPRATNSFGGSIKGAAQQPPKTEKKKHTWLCTHRWWRGRRGCRTRRGRRRCLARAGPSAVRRWPPRT